MRINSINVSNFLRVKQASIEFERPVVLVAGPNGNGKSSLAEAVRMAFTEEPTRVKKKNEYDKLVHDGEKVGSINITHSQGETSFVVPKGKGEGQITHGAMNCCLDSNLFARLGPQERREFLLKLMGVKLTPKFVVDSLITRGVSKEKADQVIPLLSGGIATAQTEAQAKARDAKVVWKNTTGETYGSEKAEGWKAEVPEFDQDKINVLTENIEELQKQIDETNQAIGAVQSPGENIEELQKQLAAAREKGTQYARIQDKLIIDEAQLVEWQEKVDQAKAAAKGKREGLIHELAFALADLTNEQQPLGTERETYQKAITLLCTYEDHHGPIEEQFNESLAAKLPEYQRAFDLINNSVNNGKRDLAAADAAAQLALQIEEKIALAKDSQAQVEQLAALKTKLTELRTELKTKETARDQEVQKMRAADQAGLRTEQATAAHEDVKAWEEISNALKPDGIPSELIGSALEPFNSMLTEFSLVADWPTVRVYDDMGIGFGDHEYPLCGESHQWRADTLITCAIAAISGIKLVVLDRFDCLDLQGRSDALALIDDLIANADLECALILATLKSKPNGLPDHVQTEWIEGGVVQSAAEQVAA
ncbi:MAG: AAA family ATPase [Limnobacter sp.]|nr:AAA family ATPase [Limnobacter sp.]